MRSEMMWSIWKIYCGDHSLLSSTTAVQIWIIPYTSHHFWWVTTLLFLSSLANDNKNNILCLPLGVFIALMLVGLSKMPETNISNETYSTGHRHYNITHIFHAWKSTILHANSMRKILAKHLFKKNTRKFGCKILCANSYNLHVFGRVSGSWVSVVVLVRLA